MPDKMYIKLKFYSRMGRFPNLKDPKTFNEKLQWLKLHDRKPEYTRMVDKYEAKQYVSDIIGEEYTIPTLGVWDKFDDIDFDKLPDQFVLKCTHDSGGLVICRDKSKLDIAAAKKKIEKCLKVNYYWHGREWPYKDVKPKIIAEKYIDDGKSDVLPVYKFFCFNGEPQIIQSIQNDKKQNESIDYFDIDWNLLKMRQNYPNSVDPMPMPSQFDKIFQASKILSAGTSFLRIDWYCIDEKIYFSEFTFYSDAGFASFYPCDWDAILGAWITLPNIKG